MEKKVFYDSPIFGPLTKEEYQQFLCKLPQSSSDPVVSYHGFNYNSHGICLNPNKERFGDKKYYVELRTALNKAGRWVYAIDYSMNGGGHSYGVSCRGEGFETENEAKFALLCYAEQGIRRRMEWLKDAPNLDDDDDFDYGQEKLYKNQIKNILNLLKKVTYYQEVYNNQTLF